MRPLASEPYYIRPLLPICEPVRVGLGDWTRAAHVLELCQGGAAAEEEEGRGSGSGISCNGPRLPMSSAGTDGGAQSRAQAGAMGLGCRTLANDAGLGGDERRHCVLVLCSKFVLMMQSAGGRGVEVVSCHWRKLCQVLAFQIPNAKGARVL